MRLEMSLRYAEVIGDPVDQSKSPIIHSYWLRQLNMPGEYRRREITSAGLSDYFGKRREDPEWRGCNVTIPHKEAVLAHVDELDSSAAAIGAANCVTPGPAGLVGHNTDVDGVAAALAGVDLVGRTAAIIGGGGAARAAIACLANHGAGEVIVLVRDPAKAKPLRSLFSSLQIASLGAAPTLLPGAAAIINASPLGMAGGTPMPSALLTSVRDAGDPLLFDMVYEPVETAFLSSGRGRRVDGLTMLIGQAARGFELFFGAPAPAPDERLRALLLGAR